MCDASGQRMGKVQAVNIIDRMKLWARLAPPKPGTEFSNHQGKGPDGAKIIVVLAIDERGRVFQLNGGIITGATWHMIINGRTAITTTLDQLDVQDRPEMPDMTDHGQA